MEPFIRVLEAHHTDLNSSVEVWCHFKFSTHRVSEQGCQPDPQIKNRVLLTYYHNI